MTSGSFWAKVDVTHASILHPCRLNFPQIRPKKRDVREATRTTNVGHGYLASWLFERKAIFVNESHLAPAKAVYTPKETWVAYLLWFLLGAWGGHHFYLGKTGRAVSYIFTLGWLGVGVLIDLFTLPSQVRVVNTQRAVGIS